jgi:hypothetical protein
MNNNKLILYLFLSTILLLSCRKERISDDLSIFIGEWKFKSKIYYDKGTSYCRTDTLQIENCNEITLIIKKNGKAFLNTSSGEEKYLINFDNDATSGYGWLNKKSIKYGCNINDTTVSKFPSTSPIFYLKSEKIELNPICYINSDQLIMYSDIETDRIIGSYSGNSNRHYTFWEKK